MEPVVFLLSILFLVLVFSVCGKKALRLLAALLFTIAALVWVITPLIVSGFNPELVVFLVGVPILVCIVYLSEGFTTLSHISTVVVLLNFLFISALTEVSVLAAHLTGVTSTDDSFLGLAGINLQELLIGGIMLGTLGILTEMVVTQVATVMEFIASNSEASEKQIFKNAYTVGVAHLGSIINTLFLVYAGVSFSLLIVYAGAGSSLSDALNYEPLVSEIIRTLVGTIGLITAMPTSTFLATWWLKRQKFSGYNHP
ncbi:MAG: YibE/F family protein [Patescibacteria group bacterium]|nr:YibE/F family protein [Patescibacteria group bacterium]